MTTLSTPRNVLQQTENLLELSICIFNPLCQTNLLGTEFAADVIFLVLPSVNNDLIIYVFPTCVGCEVTHLGSTELTKILYISVKVICTSNFSGKESWMLRLNIWMISLLEGIKYSAQNIQP